MTGSRGARINQRWRVQGRYCCSTTPCHRKNDTIICKNGLEKSITDQCGHDLNVNSCPTATQVSYTALSVNQDRFQCYESGYIKSNTDLGPILSKLILTDLQANSTTPSFFFVL